MQSQHAAAPLAPADAPKKKRVPTWVRALLSLAVVGLVFFYALPQFADFSKVAASLRAMTWLEIATLAGASVWNLATYWLVMMAALPGSNVWQSMKVNQISTAVANTVPGGGAIGVGVTYGLYTAYGFSRSEIGLSVLVSGIWNNFVKLGMPIVAVALLAATGGATSALVVAAVIGVLVLVGALVLFALALRSDRLARRIGDGVGRLASAPRRLFKKAPFVGWGESLAGFRGRAKHLLSRRWLHLTLASVLSHLSLYLVLLLAVRHIGIAPSRVTWAETLAAFAFIRLVSALPITPGGLGVVELGLTASLVAAGGPRPEVVAAVLVYRVMTYVLPIPFGGLAYLEWKRTARSRRERVAAERQSAENDLETASTRT